MIKYILSGTIAVLALTVILLFSQLMSSQKINADYKSLLKANSELNSFYLNEVNTLLSDGQRKTLAEKAKKINNTQ